MEVIILLFASLASTFGAHLPFIIGGTRVSDPSKYPWQGSLKYNGGHSCGCSLISTTWAVTAAHCVGSPKLHYSVGFASVYWRQTENVDIRQIIVHENYDEGPGTFPNDIALLNIDEVSENSHRKSIVITSSDQAGNTDCYITGWGVTETGPGGSVSNQLQEAKINVFTEAGCEREWGSSITGGQICVGDSVNGRGSCSGDSGGPLVCKVGGSYQLVGATSWGLYGCYTRKPAVYTRLTYYRDWIREKSGV